jgi:hypothetical protein
MEVGNRVKLIEMGNDPNPIEAGSEGVINHIGGGVVNVSWDNGRSLGLVIGEDKFNII